MNPKVKLFEKLSFPIPIFKHENSIDNDNKLKLLILVSSMHGQRHKNYWNDVRNIIKNLPKNITIFIKDHPQAISKAQHELAGFQLDFSAKKQNMELFVLKHNITTIFGHGSTGLITASWMGLCVYDFTNIPSLYNDWRKTYFNSKKVLINNREKIFNNWSNILSEIQN